MTLHSDIIYRRQASVIQRRVLDSAIKRIATETDQAAPADPAPLEDEAPAEYEPKGDEAKE
jgi:hypothetical protein